MIGKLKLSFQSIIGATENMCDNVLILFHFIFGIRTIDLGRKLMRVLKHLLFVSSAYTDVLCIAYRAGRHAEAVFNDLQFDSDFQRLENCF